MKLSQYFLPILRDDPKEAEIVSHRLMLRAGMIRQESAGIYSWLPMGYKVLRNIERIVREVLAELDSRHFRGRTADAVTENDGGRLVVSCRVVTLSEVEGRLNSVRRLVVPPRAVVTPAVRDELQHRKIALEYAAEEETKCSGPLRLVMASTGQQIDPAALTAELAAEDVTVDRRPFDCPISAVDYLAGKVAQQHTLGLLLTGQTAAAACLANRHRHVRAVDDAEKVDAVGANLLILDPAAGVFLLKRIVVDFCRGGVRRCPERFRERLS